MTPKTKTKDTNVDGGQISVESCTKEEDGCAETLVESMKTPITYRLDNDIQGSITLSSANTKISANMNNGHNQNDVTDTAEKEKRRSKDIRDLDQHEKQHKKKKPTNDPEVLFETSWICSECKEAECAMNPNTCELLICDGVCQRLFHYPCAGLEKLPEADESFICSDCSNRKHACSFCQHYGLDNEDVFKCDKKSCGFFFHESCLEMHNVKVDLVELADKKSASFEARQSPNVNDDGISVFKRRFVCPAHSCWTCTQPDMKEQSEKAEIPDKTRSVSESIVGHSTSSRTRTKKTSQPPKTVFQARKNDRIYRCLECPISYHLACIPPSAKFHELATLCHEHAQTCKLPDLDQESSLQCKIEQAIDRKFDKQKSKSTRATKMRKLRGSNPFFPSLKGGTNTYYEIMLQDMLHRKFDDFTDDRLFFCLPCDFKGEVHLKPPMYKHIQCNQYNPINRPQKVLSSGLEMCECVGFCGDDCLNRSLYVECFGEGPNSKKQSNCNVGPDCGNRLFSRRKFIRCKPKREEGRGWGLTVCENVKRGELIVEYVGEIIDAEAKEKRLIEWTIEHPNDPNFYIMALQPGWFIDAREKANLSRFINHSCEPNSMIVPINVMGRIRCGIRAIRDIVANEFISYDYHFDTRQRDKFVCRCGSLKCRGSMQAGHKTNDPNSSSRPSKKSKIEMFNEAKAAFELDNKFLHDYYEDAKQRCSLVKETVPGVDKENKDELVANGPQEKYKTKARNNRIFLWRTAVAGADFAERFARVDRKIRERPPAEQR